jgi:hypothetical protein
MPKKKTTKKEKVTFEVKTLRKVKFTKNDFLLIELGDGGTLKDANGMNEVLKSKIKEYDLKIKGFLITFGRMQIKVLKEEIK